MNETELDALLSRYREDRVDPSGKNRNAVVYDCYRMFEDLATRYQEELEMRDRYKRQSNAWRDRALQLSDLLARVGKQLEDGTNRICNGEAES